MDSQILQKIIKSDKYMNDLVLGIFSQDEIPMKLPFGKALIFNTANVNQGKIETG